VAYAAAQAKAAERLAEPIRRVEARGLAWAADAAVAIADAAGRGPGRRGRPPPPWPSHALHDRGEAVRVPKKRPRRGRPPQTEEPQGEARARLVVHREALGPAEDTYGWTVVATTVPPEGCTDTEILQAYQGQHGTGEPGVRWSKTPAAIRPVWREKPARMAALAMRTVVGWLG
jgi:hypothetical protein